MLHRHYFQAVLLTVLVLSALPACAQETDEPNPIKWSIRAQAADSFSKWDLFTLELHAAIDRGWHLYSTEKVEGGPWPTRITLSPGQKFELAGEIDSPAPRSAYDPNFQVATEFYEGEVAFIIPIKLTAGTVGEKVRVQVRYQTCTPTICLPPKLIVLEASLVGEDTKSVHTGTTAEAASSARPLAVVGLVPDFNFTDFDGKARRFSEFRGRVVLLDFWASWCSPCLADIPDLKNAYQKYRAQGFEIIGMDSETLGQKETDLEFAKDAQTKAREIVNTRGVNWAQSTAESSLPVAAGTFGIENLPARILIDRSGKVVARIKNVSDLDELLPALLGAPRQ
ncbi:MAG: protein-disulfide reductase DsbD domain-containing protein [Pyrinomonadaceae bacterium]